MRCSKVIIFEILFILVTGILLSCEKTEFHGWHTMTVDSEGNSGYESSIIIDSNYNAHISYHCFSDKDYLKYAKWNKGKWEIQVIDTNESNYSCIVLDSHGYPNILYSDYYNDLLIKYTKWNGKSWETQIVYTGGVLYGSPSITLDSQDQPHICFYDGATDNF
jgi:hypothetical protein